MPYDAQGQTQDARIDALVSQFVDTQSAGYSKEARKIASALTLSDIEGWQKRSGNFTATPGQIYRSHLSRLNVACDIYAGVNIMSRHASRPKHGMTGGGELILRMGTPEAHKHKAGGWLKDARHAHARGDTRAFHQCLAKAASHRLEAARVAALLNGAPDAAA